MGPDDAGLNLPADVLVIDDPVSQQRTCPKSPKCPRMPPPKNVLWIMCDQLRHDYLGCTGHPTLKTPNIDAMTTNLH